MNTNFWFGYATGVFVMFSSPIVVKGLRLICKFFLRLTA